MYFAWSGPARPSARHGRARDTFESGFSERRVQRPLCLGDSRQDLGPGLLELLLLFVGPRPHDRAGQSAELEEFLTQLEETCELRGLRQERVRGLGVDAPPGQEILAEL